MTVTHLPIAPRILAWSYHDVRPTAGRALAEHALEQQLLTAPDYGLSVTDILDRFHTGLSIVQRAWIASRIDVLYGLADDVHEAEVHRTGYYAAVDMYCDELHSISGLLRAAPVTFPCDQDYAS